MKYRKKPVIVEAMQFTEKTKDQCLNFARGNCYPQFGIDGNPELKIHTLEGDMIVSLGDYIIEEPFPNGNRCFYPCKPDIFEKIYEICLDH